MKILENESLHMELQNCKEENSYTIRHLEARLEILEQDKENYNKAIEDLNYKNNAVIDRLKEELLHFQETFRKKEEDLSLSNVMVEK